MATFTEMIVTDKGKIQYAKAMAGKQIVFTRVAFGEGKPASLAAAEKLTALVGERISGTVESIDTTTEAGVAIIMVSVDNSTLNAAVGIREIGVFNTDPDTGKEVMYSYCYSENDIDVIPSSINGSVIWRMMIRLAITNAK